LDFRPVLYVIGLLLCILAASMTLPLLADLYTGSSDWNVFLLGIVITGFFGGSLVLSNTRQKHDISVRQAFMLTALSWVTISAFAALPFRFSELNMSFTDSFFEAMSGITTTGSTVLTGLDEAPRGILLWRAILQWLGGMGFIVMAMSLLPFLKVGGMRLFRTESSENEKALPRAAQLASSIGFVYVALTLLCTVAYMITGLGTFDALAHAMTTVSTGGFSTSDQSISKFSHAGTEMVAIVFMILGGLPFVLYIKALGGNLRPLFQDTQVRWFMGLVVTITTAMVTYLIIDKHFGFFDALRHSLFNVVSVITTTGFASTDYTLWGQLSVCVFFFITFVGACAGSTAGGVKIFRLQVLLAAVRVQVKKLLHPSGVFIPHYNRTPIPQDVSLSVMSFFFVYVIIFALSTVTLSLVGLDFLTAASGAATALSNVGPGLGETIGPSGTFAPLPDSAKWVLSLCMLMGRLELFTVLVMFSPHFWRH
jgi:trk system potassium uptake protein TrkH